MLFPIAFFRFSYDCLASPSCHSGSFFTNGNMERLPPFDGTYGSFSRPSGMLSAIPHRIHMQA